MKKFEHGGDVYNNSVRLDFSSNINPFGLPESAGESIIKNIGALSRYPDAECRELRRAISAREGVKCENILCGNGAADLIFAVTRAFAPKKALLTAPTFSEYERALKSVGCEINYHVLREENDFALTEEFLDFPPETDMIFLCNPNNPVGNVTDRGLADRILEKCRENSVLLIADECFADFAEDGYSLKGKTPVIKAFTKLYAMAGLRLGYMLADTETVEKVGGVMQPWSVNAAAQLAGIAAAGDTEYVKKSVEYIRAERRFLTDELRRLGLRVYNSQANFVFFKAPETLYERLLDKGILIRSCDNFRGLGRGFYRAAVRLRGENEELVAAIGEAVKWQNR